MSLDLFKLYGEIILGHVDEVSGEIMVNGVKMNIIRYADDRPTVLVGTSAEGLQQLLDKTAAISEKI